jgi:hypothetical protein
MPDKGKVERPFSYIRQDFFLGRRFRNLDDIQIEGSSYRMRQHAALVPECLRSNTAANPPPAPKRRGRPPTRPPLDQTNG